MTKFGNLLLIGLGVFFSVVSFAQSPPTQVLRVAPDQVLTDDEPPVQAVPFDFILKELNASKSQVQGLLNSRAVKSSRHRDLKARLEDIYSNIDSIIMSLQWRDLTEKFKKFSALGENVLVYKGSDFQDGENKGSRWCHEGGYNSASALSRPVGEDKASGKIFIAVKCQ